MKTTTKAEMRKREIIDKIVLLMDEDGIKNISIADICKATGLSVGSFYHYFKSKDAIYAELFRQMDNYFLNNIEDICNSENELENMKQFAIKYFIHVKNWGYYCNRTIILYTLDKDNFYYKSNQRAFYKIIDSITNRAYEKHQLAKGMTAQKAKDMLMILIRGYSLDWAKSDSLDYPMNIFLEHLDLFISSISAN